MIDVPARLPLGPVAIPTDRATGPSGRPARDAASRDQLPTVREAVAQLAINPNTVQKAYRELEQEGVVGGRPGVGTFVMASAPGPTPSDRASLDRGLQRWLRSAFEAGLDRDGVIALFEANLRDLAQEGVA